MSYIIQNKTQYIIIAKFRHIILSYQKTNIDTFLKFKLTKRMGNF